MSLDMAFRLAGFGELLGLDLGVPVGGVPVGLEAILALSPAVKDLDRGLSPEGEKTTRYFLNGCNDPRTY